MTGRRFWAAIIIIAAVAVIGQLFYPLRLVAEEPKKFASREQLAEYIKANSLLAQFGYGRAGRDVWVTAAPRGLQSAESKDGGQGAAAPQPAEMKAPSDGHSTTNVQVEGVDESDIIKNDGRYLYVVSGSQVHIVDAYPADKSRLLSTIKCDGYPSGMYLKGDRLMIISQRSSAPGMLVSVYDITDRAKPVELKTLTWEGGCAGSRMIGDFVYLVVNQPVVFEGDSVNLPRMTEDGTLREVLPGEIFFFDYPDYSYRYTLIVSVSINGDGQAAYRTFLTGDSQNIYASPENLYLTGAKAPDMGALTGRLIEGLASLVTGEAADRIKNIGSSSSSPDQKVAQAEQVLEGYMAGLGYAEAAALEEKIRQLREKLSRDIERERNKTVIQKFSLTGNSIEYRGRGEVNGQLLNQFSMDEEGGYLRVATTSQGFLLSDRPVARNNIYVMDGDLKVVGSLEGLAPTERIYSARFMGSRVYLVTFRNIDPLFVIDLKNPESPRVLGELKIPGFSDYLHPYDENHLIGVGKEVAPVPEPRPLPGPVPMDSGVAAPEFIPPIPVRQQGVKIALFDVSDPARPREVSRYVVEHPYSNSEVSTNHKAFLFSRERGLMALPVSYTEYESVQDPVRGKGIMPRYRYWQGMYVFNVNLTDGIRLKGKIDHPEYKNAGYGTEDPVRRAAYINDVFYTVSDGAVKLSRIDSLKEIKLVRLPREDNYPIIYKAQPAIE